ncbi:MULTISPECIES: sulfate/molybdate ABC transporter ATP-binding protein [Microbacterium]|uniref:sulfate/molybdate ABC transporter ATP-binding protein n=1 Tax=Microbacterium TaxID=33882 RepID=UPI00278B9BF0|nr:MULTISPECIES: ATP-binding cassette domain-containing protein [Microbacterium]MDQ1084898.1 molybdate transport system ATP-binding protein [Microbacterium sp. SORGH_AS_0344]MDQ1169824.1 molybdate transport system ATP-binding protein [Microbacterium proteolyticum]
MSGADHTADTGFGTVPDAAALTARLRVRRRDFDVDIELDVSAGETVAVMGRSGAGKSTLLGALAGLTPLDEGEISIDGRVLDRAPRLRTDPMHRGIVLLGQDARLFPHLTARENVAFGPRAAGVPASVARSAAEGWLERVGLPGAGDRRPSQLSGGEQQRVAVARALAAEPRVVLLDEPLVALDAVTASEIRAMLRERLAGVTTVAVTHDAVDAAALADRLVIVERGRVTQHGPVREVLATPATEVAAKIAGLERIVGVARGGAFERRGLRLESTDAASRAAAADDGASVAAVFRAADVRFGHGSRGVVSRLEPTPTGVRIVLDVGAAEVSPAEAVGMRPGDVVRWTVPPACLRFVPAS